MPGHQGALVPVIADFHAALFRDFFNVVASTLQLSDVTPRFETTATLVHANQLHFASKSDLGGQHRISSAPLAIENLQWPIAVCELGTLAWIARVEAMGKALAGAYGATP